MPAYPYEKKPAFFRVTPAELFFEAEASEVGAVTEVVDNQALDAELDAILSGLDA